MSLQQIYDRWQAVRLWQSIEVVVAAAFLGGVLVGVIIDRLLGVAGY